MNTQGSPVPYTHLGASGLVVSRIALGTMTFGERTDEAEARRIFDDALAHGVNFIDTADTYTGGISEQIVGRLIADKRNSIVLATKVANPGGSGPNERGLSRKWVTQRVHHCLKNLGTDFVDVLYLHKEDLATPLEETIRALADLQRAGAIRYFGISNYRDWRIARVCAICDSEGIDRPVANQIVYHALNRTPELELLPASHFHGVGTVLYSPIARGVLSGKYAPNVLPPSGSRAAMKNSRILETEYQPENLLVAQEIARHAEQLGVPAAAFAIAWVLANPMVSVALAGPRTLEQWQDYARAASVVIGPDSESFVDGLVAPGTTAVPHFVDPRFPPEGRPTARA